MDNTWQIPPLCHLLLLRSFVLDGTDNMHLFSQPRRCLTRSKDEGLDCFVQGIAKTCWQWCHTSNFGPRRKTSPKRAQCVDLTNKTLTHVCHNGERAHTFLCDLEPNNKSARQVSETTHKLRTRETRTTDTSCATIT